MKNAKIFDLSSLVVLDADGVPRTSTETIAKGVQQAHRGVLQLIRKHIDSFRSFGEVQFQMRLNRQGSATEFGMLNEHQAGLLIAFMRNSPLVIEFKVALIKEFFRMRDALVSRQSAIWKELQAAIAKDAGSKVRASFGSHLMLDRKREKPALVGDIKRLSAQIQPSLLN